MNRINLVSRRNDESLQNIYAESTPEGFAELKVQLPEVMKENPDKISFFNINEEGYFRKFPGTDELSIQLLDPTKEQVNALVAKIEESFREVVELV